MWYKVSTSEELDKIVTNFNDGADIIETGKFVEPGWYYIKQYARRQKCGCCYDSVNTAVPIDSMIDQVETDIRKLNQELETLKQKRDHE